MQLIRLFLLGIIYKMKQHDSKEVKAIADRLMRLLEAENELQCPKCMSKQIIKFGSAKKQRYQCKSCKITFNAEIHTLFYSSRQSREVWFKFIECELYKMTLQEIADTLSLSKTTCFSMRHKLYNQCLKIKE